MDPSTLACCDVFWEGAWDRGAGMPTVCAAGRLWTALNPKIDRFSIDGMVQNTKKGQGETENITETDERSIDRSLPRRRFDPLDDLT